MSTENKSLVWFITGCSSGFGESLTLIALEAGHKVIATSRNPSKDPELVKRVEELGGIWLALDITSPKETLQGVVDKGIKKFGRIDVLVNCAGIGILGAIEDFNAQEQQRVMDVNFFGPLNLIQAVLPQMRSQHSGTIVSISSGAAINPRPSMVMYGASKFALEGLSQGLAVEVESFGIRVLIVQPGAFTTNMMNAITLTENFTPEYEGTVVGQFMGIFRESSEAGPMKTPNDVDKGCQGIFEVVTGLGRGAGKEGYLRLPLSADISQRTLDQVKRLEEGRVAFKDIWEHTAHDGGEMKAFPPKK